MIALLVIYCLKDSIYKSHHGLPDLIAIIFYCAYTQMEEKYTAKYCLRHCLLYDTCAEFLYIKSI